MGPHDTFCGNRSERQGSVASHAHSCSHVNAARQPQPTLPDHPGMEPLHRFSACMMRLCMFYLQ